MVDILYVLLFLEVDIKFQTVMNWEIGIDMYTLMCIKWITSKNLLYKKINKIH